MTNEVFRNKVKGYIENALREASNASGADHSGLEGRIREIAVANLFKPLLPFGVCTGTGKITDSNGHKSRETDVVIYSKTVLPSVMFDDATGIFPIESCLYAIEVKTKTSSTEISDAIEKSQVLQTLNFQAGCCPRYPNPWAQRGRRLLTSLFAFGSDLAENGKSEFQRYQELDPNWKDNPSLHNLCVVGRGYWWWHGIQNGWESIPASNEHDEVINFLSVIMNTIPREIMSRGHPQLGAYLK